MTFVVPGITEVLMNKITLWISIRAIDWTVERAIIASNEALIRVTYLTLYEDTMPIARDLDILINNKKVLQCNRKRRTDLDLACPMRGGGTQSCPVFRGSLPTSPVQGYPLSCPGWATGLIGVPSLDIGLTGVLAYSNYLWEGPLTRGWEGTWDQRPCTP